MIPKDPIMLLSWINTQLRDHYASPVSYTHLIPSGQPPWIMKPLITRWKIRPL